MRTTMVEGGDGREDKQTAATNKENNNHHGDKVWRAMVMVMAMGMVMMQQGTCVGGRRCVGG